MRMNLNKNIIILLDFDFVSTLFCIKNLLEVPESEY